MRNLNKADIVPKDLLNSVILSKRGSNKTRMEAMRNDLEERYDEYCDKVDNNTLHLLSEKWHYDKDAIASDGYFLYHQYDNSKASMSDLRAKIIEANNGESVLKCPICELRDATELDHYVPRQLFPEFSVHSYNLIPTCHECNNNKSTAWCDSGKRVFFNAYYDMPTDELLFDISVLKENGILRLVIALKNLTTPKESTRIAISTIKSLDLIPYINQKLNEKFSQKLKETILRRKYWKGTDEEFLKVEKDILEETIREISDINNWERIVLSTIKDEQIVEDWLKERF